MIIFTKMPSYLVLKCFKKIKINSACIISHRYKTCLSSFLIASLRMLRNK